MVKRAVFPCIHSVEFNHYAYTFVSLLLSIMHPLFSFIYLLQVYGMLQCSVYVITSGYMAFLI